MVKSFELPYILQFNETFQVGYRNLEFLYPLKKNKERILELLNDQQVYASSSILDYPILPFRKTDNIYELNAGNTPLLSLKELSKVYLSEVYLKCEHANPSGSFKDRESVVSLNASWLNEDKHTVIYSSGNAACSAAYFCGINNKPIIAVVPGDIYPEKLNYLLDNGAKVIVLGDKETGFENGYRLYIKAIEILQASNSGIEDLSVANPYRTEGGKTVAFEMINQLNDVPSFIITPTANGSLISGIWKGFKELLEVGYIQSMPRLVSIGIKGASPIFDRINSYQPQELPQNENSTWSVGSTLAASESFDLNYAIRAIEESNGIALSCDESEILEGYKQFGIFEKELMEQHELILEPSAMTPFVGLKQLHEKKILVPDDKVVLLSTGDGRKSKSLLRGIFDLPGFSQEPDQSVSVSNDKNLIFIKEDLEALLDAISTNV